MAFVGILRVGKMDMTIMVLILFVMAAAHGGHGVADGYLGWRV